MNVDELQNEIMGMIFYIHVYENLGSREILLLTSRRWHAIAKSLAILWRTISWGSYCEPLPISVNCRTLDYLAHIIRRTGQAMFDLNIGGPQHHPSVEKMMEFISSVGQKWLSRCRSLTISTLQEETDNITMEVLEQFLHYGTLDALESVGWDCRGYGSRRKGLAMLMSHVASFSPRLRTLKLRYGFSGFHTQEFPSQIPGMLRRIRSLTLIFINQPVPWNELEGLEHLELTRCRRSSLSQLDAMDIPCPSNLSQLIAPRLTSLCLEGDFLSGDFPSKDLFHQLKRLALRWFTTASDENIFPESFPSLVYLGLAPREGNSNLNYIQAHDLDELEISLNGDALRIPPLATTLAPRVLRLDGPDNLNPCFAGPDLIWGRLEEMHLTVERNRPRTEVIVDSLSCSSSRGAKYFPQLRIFTIRFPYPLAYEDPPSKGQMMEVADEIRSVIPRREAAGLPPLGQILVGWYWQNVSFHTLGDPSLDWRVTSWVNCSQQ